MYHRIAQPQSDVWNIAVSPVNFEQQLQLLKKSGKVVPLKALVQGLEEGSLQSRSMAITFDDGYADNYEVAVPLLEKYRLPATFFIASGNIGKETEFWWDELEQLILFSEDLPPAFSMNIGGEAINISLAEEERLDDKLHRQHQQWRAFVTEPPGQRAALFLQLWQHLRPLPALEQQRILAQIRQWANVPQQYRANYRSMTRAQLQQLSAKPLFDVGIHTVTHPALADHTEDFQFKELTDNREQLREITGMTPALLAYPYGSYNHQTLNIAEKLKIKGAVTTEDTLVTPQTNLLRIGRFQVNNWNGSMFTEQLKGWQSTKNPVL
ncbi:polysaccharide deacetylase [Flammeovirgaceae bacterium 311]|nr:polysaccharide deacetylase [Flammeovirgaceae bacterium 311]